MSSPTGSRPVDVPPPRGAGHSAPAGAPGLRRRAAVGLFQTAALVAIVALAVLAGAILVEDTSVPGWIDGLAIGAGSVLLTLSVLLNGRIARRR